MKRLSIKKGFVVNGKMLIIEMYSGPMVARPERYEPDADTLTAITRLLRVMIDGGRFGYARK